VNRTGRTVVTVQVRLQRSDWGLLAGALAAVGLIGGFLVWTSGWSPEADAGPPTTDRPAASSRLVRVGSDADPDFEWADAIGTFRPECEGGQVAYVDAKVARLPTDLRFSWRVVTDEETLRTAPLADRPGVSSRLIQGDGLATAFRPSAEGRAVVRFRFAERSPDVTVPLGLTVLDVPPEQSFVLAAPPLTCRGTD
jgi:hypothetical protein